MRGSVCLLMMIVCNSGEYQLSETICIGCSFPISPAGMVIVRRVPSASTPSIVCLPSDSFFASLGSGFARGTQTLGPGAGHARRGRRYKRLFDAP